MTAVREENAYYVKLSTIRKEIVAVTKDIDIWYKRLGHTNKRIVEEMKKENLVKEMNKEKRQCEPCVEGKMCRKLHLKTGRILEL